MPFHLFAPEKEQAWIRKQENLEDGLLRIGQWEVNIDSDGAVGLQSSCYDTYDSRTRRMNGLTESDDSEGITLATQIFDSTRTLTFLLNRPESAFFEDLPLGTLPVNRQVASTHLQPLITSILADFAADPALAINPYDWRRYWGKYRTDSTFTVKWAFDQQVLLGDQDITSPEDWTFYTAKGFWQKWEFAVQHFETFAKFDRFEVELGGSWDFNTGIVAATLADRDAITDRKTSMLVTVLSEEKNYRLLHDLVTWYEVKQIYHDSFPYHSYYQTYTDFSKFATPQRLDFYDPICGDLAFRDLTQFSYKYDLYENLLLPFMQTLTWTVDPEILLENPTLAPTYSATLFANLSVVVSNRLDTTAEKPLEVDCFCDMEVSVPPVSFPNLYTLDWEVVTLPGYGEAGYGVQYGL